MFTWIVVALSATQSQARTPECVTAYRKANSDYVRTLARLSGGEFAGEAGAWIAGAGMAACIAKFRSARGAVVCALILGTASGVSALYSESNETQRELLEASQLRQSHKLFQVYSAHKRGDVEDDEHVQEFMQELNVDAGLRSEILKALARKMESGELCKDGRAEASFGDVLKELRPFVN